jgi:hypothetical protein
MTNQLRFSLLVTAIGGFTVSANAFMFDNFTQGPATLSILSGTGSIEGQQTAANVPGTQRDAWLSVTANPFDQMVRFVVNGNANGASFYNGDTGTMGFVQLDYDGVDAEGNNGAQSAGPGLNLNLSGDNRFQFNFLSADSPVRVDITAITYGAPDRTSVGTFTTAGNINSSTMYSFNFADMSVGAGSTQQFSLTDADRLVFRFTPINPSGDFALGSIATVPEPSSMAIIAAGLAGIVGLRRRRRR